MSQPIVVAPPAEVELAPAPIPADWILAGTPEARSRQLARSQDGASTVMAWSCTAGRFNWHYTVDETVHIISGLVFVTNHEGEECRLGPGDMAFFPAGSRSTWRVPVEVRKLAVCRQAMPLPFGFALRAPGTSSPASCWRSSCRPRRAPSTRWRRRRRRVPQGSAACAATPEPRRQLVRRRRIQRASGACATTPGDFLPGRFGALAFLPTDALRPFGFFALRVGFAATEPAGGSAALSALAAISRPNRADMSSSASILAAPGFGFATVRFPPALASSSWASTPRSTNRSSGFMSSLAPMP